MSVSFKPLKFVIAALALLTPAAAMAQSEGDSVVTEETQVGAWLLRCVTVGGRDRTCALTIGVFNSVQQQELGILRIFAVAPENRLGDERFAAQLSTPTHVQLRERVGIQVDQATIETVDYEICSYRQCVTTFALSNALQSAFAAGFNGTVRIVDASGEPQLLDFSLEGFARGISLLDETL